MSVQGQELHTCCSEIAGAEGISLCHLVPLWLLACLLLLASVGRDAALEPSVLLHFVLAEMCPGDVIAAVSAAPGGCSSSSALSVGKLWNTAAATSWSVTLGGEAGSSRPLKCVDLQLISSRLDFSARKPVIEAIAVFIGQQSFRTGCTAFEMGLKCKPVAQISICMI